MITVILANGFEEIEALTPVDILRRAGLDVKTVSIGNEKTVIGSHGIPVIADMTADELSDICPELLILPGGMPGAKNIDESHYTDSFIERTLSRGGRIAAICAAPMILGHRGLLKGKNAVCYPGFENELTGAQISDSSVITDGSFTTAKGMGAALEFSKELVKLMLGEEKAREISESIMERKQL